MPIYKRAQTQVEYFLLVHYEVEPLLKNASLNIQIPCVIILNNKKTGLNHNVK